MVTNIVIVIIIAVGVATYAKFFRSEHLLSQISTMNAQYIYIYEEINNNIASSLSRDNDLAYGYVCERKKMMMYEKRRTRRKKAMSICKRCTNLATYTLFFQQLHLLVEMIIVFFLASSLNCLSMASISKKIFNTIANILMRKNVNCRCIEIMSGLLNYETYFYNR